MGAGRPVLSAWSRAHGGPLILGQTAGGAAQEAGPGGHHSGRALDVKQCPHRPAVGTSLPAALLPCWGAEQQPWREPGRKEVRSCFSAWSPQSRFQGWTRDLCHLGSQILPGPWTSALGGGGGEEGGPRELRPPRPGRKTDRSPDKRRMCSWPCAPLSGPARSRRARRKRALRCPPAARRPPRPPGRACQGEGTWRWHLPLRDAGLQGEGHLPPGPGLQSSGRVEPAHCLLPAGRSALTSPVLPMRKLRHSDLAAVL